MSFDKLPAELRRFSNWINWQYELTKDNKWTKVPYSPITNKRASPADSSDWSDFETAVKNTHAKRGLGFVFANTPFVGIDMDNKADDPSFAAYHDQLIPYFNSYTEWSPSGKGYHTIVESSISKSLRAPGIEIYAGNHYFTMTGEVLLAQPVRSVSLDFLFGDNRVVIASVSELESPQTVPDVQIIQLAVRAENGAKFNSLFYQGSKTDYGGDWSAADQALMNILAFYTQDRAQLKRIFKMSRLVRSKTHREDYLDRTIAKALDQTVPALDLSQIERASETRSDLKRTPKPQGQHTLSNELNLTYPPGLMGEIAKYIYASAHKPAHEIAIAGAVALMAAICGRAYSVNRAGLNQYVVLLAKTGRGKEIMATAIAELLGAVAANGEPLATKFSGPSVFASGESILKELSRQPIPSFVAIHSEIGAFMRRICHPKANPRDENIRRVLLDVYTKSGPSSIINPMVYSDSLKNTSVVRAPNLTLLGESTPDDFYESFDSNMISVGLLPRLLLIEYSGKRPPTNEAKIGIDKSLLDTLTQLVSYAVRLNTTNKYQEVILDEDAIRLSKAYELRADDEINKDDSNIHAELWNRSHLKVLKLAATVAVGVNMIQPVITAGVLQWAISVVDHGTNKIFARFEDGQLGTPVNANRQYADMLTIIQKFFSGKQEFIQGKIINEQARALGFIPYWYVTSKLRRTSSFANEKDPMWAIEKMLKSFVTEGTLSEIDDVNKVSGRKQRHFKFHLL